MTMPGEVTIDFGIDLGTTNSAIAVFVEGMSQIIKCSAPPSADITPSVVSLSGDRQWVGGVAKDRLMRNPDSTFSEFKRIMGTTRTRPLPEGGHISPEELSAAVLRSLRQDAFEFCGVDVTAAVITVPAAFDTAQIAATRRAGEMAGFSHVETLQEPIAAALAYGFDQAGDGMFLVFDLGGGTFDAALLRCASGVFSVISHRGDNDLGGGRWDSALVDHVILPKLKALGHDLAGASDQQSKLFRLLKFHAEQVRIELSRKHEEVFISDVVDDAGNALPDITVTLSEFEPLIEADLGRAVEFCQSLLAEAGVSPSNVSKVILVGGPTRTPALRRAVQSMGIELATMVDPMTVVARGAAVYAASRPRPVDLASAPTESAVFQLVYDAMVEQEKDEVIVGLRLERSPKGKGIGAVRVIATDGSWDSGLVRLENGAAIVSAKLIAPGTVTFKVSAITTDGAPLTVTPEAFSVTRAVAAAAAPVNHSIGVGVDDTGSGRTFHSVVKRRATMPVFERSIYRTTRSVSPREPDAEPIHLLFLEGESPVPERNLKVGEIVISSDKITRPLPANSEVEITVRWEQGQDPKASAYIPFLDQHFDEILTIQKKQLPDVGVLEEQVAEIRGRVGVAGSSDSFAKQLHEIDVRIIDAKRGDPAAAHSAARQVGQMLDDVERDASPKLLADAIARIAEIEQWARDILSKYGTLEDQRILEALIVEAHGASQSGNHRDVEYRNQLILTHAWQILFRQPAVWIEEFADLSAKAATCTDPVRAGELIQSGRAALDRQDIDELINTVRALWRLFPETSSALHSFGIRAVNS